MAGKMKFIEEQFKKNLKKRHLKQTTIDKCDVVMHFCPIVSRAGTDISAALSQLYNVVQLVILVVLHHTFDPDKTIPDSNAAVNRENTFAVDCLFSEDTGLLQCQTNEDAFERIAKYLKPLLRNKQAQKMGGVHGKTTSIEAEFKEKLNNRGLTQTTINKCDAILVFCPIVSRAGTDISAALSQLDNVDKHVILVVLHHTFDPDKTIPDSNAAVDRKKTFVVDCLFNEDTGLLQCQRNEDALNEIAKYLLFNGIDDNTRKTNKVKFGLVLGCSFVVAAGVVGFVLYWYFY
ncbi:uncharacterized protein [Misgurnus anguillicaudatus]|uniref:uncharacterized protein n=1 Tax=Misgurnus anguillicaudatus TaxID=75329 RepID=UPI003CCFC181